MSYTILKSSNREQWLQQREMGIGSSEVASVVGLNPFQTPYQLWRRKKKLDPPCEENFAMRAGHYLEDAVSKFFADATASEIIKSSAGDWLIRNDEKHFLQVSPDRTFWRDGDKHNAENKGILEIKTTQKTIDANDLPKHWFCQLQYQLGVAELSHGALAWLTCGRTFDYKNIAFVPDFYAWLVEEVERFWTDYIIGNKEPEVVSVEDAVLKYATHTDGKVIEVGSEIYEVYKTLKDVKAEIAKLDERKEAMEDKLKLAFGDAEAISFGGETLATWKAPKPSDKIDTKKLKELHPDVIAECTTQVQGSRRLLIK